MGVTPKPVAYYAIKGGEGVTPERSEDEIHICIQAMGMAVANCEADTNNSLTKVVVKEKSFNFLSLSIHSSGHL